MQPAGAVPGAHRVLQPGRRRTRVRSLRGMGGMGRGGVDVQRDSKREREVGEMEGWTEKAAERA